MVEVVVVAVAVAAVVVVVVARFLVATHKRKAALAAEVDELRLFVRRRQCQGLAPQPTRRT